MQTDKLSAYDFGQQLLETNDLDPVYILLHHSGFDREKLLCWLLSYWCFYHVGTASWIVDQKDYWEAMRRAAGSKDYPRCPERRHFRGENARKSIEYLEEKGVDTLLEPITNGIDIYLKDVMDYVQQWVGFGPWIAFKVADMLERLDLARVRFDSTDMFLFDAPRKGAELFVGDSMTPTAGRKWAVETLVEHFSSRKAPPRYERPINSQEVETILCKWKSHMNGRYQVGEDIAACRSGLLRFARNKTSQTLLREGKTGCLW